VPTIDRLLAGKSESDRPQQNGIRNSAPTRAPIVAMGGTVWQYEEITFDAKLFAKPEGVKIEDSK
jgi:hypothetical protein